MNGPKVVAKPVSRSTTAIARAPRLSRNEEPPTPLKLSAGPGQTVRPTSNSAHQQDGTGISNMTVAGADTFIGRDATHAVKDFMPARPKSTDTRHHLRNTNRSSRGKARAWPPRLQPKRSNEAYPTDRQLLRRTFSGNGSRHVASASDPAIGQTSNAVGTVASAPTSSVATSANGTAPSSSSSTASAGNGSDNGGTSSNSSSSSSSSSGSSTHGSSAEHGASLGGDGGFASGVGHAGVPGAAHGGGRGGR
jgi:hypothetical protein